MRTTWVSLVMLWALLLVGGCSTRPRAPVLSDDPVFQDDREGFRFLAPTGWTQTTRAEIPGGKRETETPLVAYRRKTGSAVASFRVSLIDLPSSAELSALVEGPSYGVEKWSQTGTPGDITVGKAAGIRYTLSGQSGKDELIKEVVCVHRGERVYLFTAIYTPTDCDSRDQLRRVVESIIWKN
jgi:hypothetical protein